MSGEYQKLSTAPTLDRNLTLMSYNVHSAIGADGVYDTARIGGLIQSIGADIVAMQVRFD